MSQKSTLKIYDLSTGKTFPMPTDEINPLINNSFFSALSRKIVLNKLISKFVGITLKNHQASEFLDKTGVAKKINKPITERFEKSGHKNLNKAFSQRFRQRKIYPLSNELDSKIAAKILCSPADAYLNIRKIKGNEIEFYPELKLDLKAMIGDELVQLFPKGGTALIFTLKPFHDHTIDYPIRSKVLSKAVEKNKRKFRVNSTDLLFAQFISAKGHQTIFDDNHRVVTKLQATPYHEEYVYVEVGAALINSIQQDNCIKGKTYKKGKQKSHFNFGSTVILLLPKSFSNQIYFPKIFLKNKNTSIHIKRRNVLALPKDFSINQKVSIADKVKLKT